MGASTTDPGKRKFTDRDVLRCFNEENRRSVGKIELSSKEITEILNDSVLDSEEVTRQAVKNRLDEMAGDQLARNKHGRSHLYSRSDDLDRLFREPEPATTGPAPSHTDSGNRYDAATGLSRRMFPSPFGFEIGYKGAIVALVIAVILIPFGVALTPTRFLVALALGVSGSLVVVLLASAFIALYQKATNED